MHTIKISDSFCEWAFELKDSGHLSIRNIIDAAVYGADLKVGREYRIINEEEKLPEPKPRKALNCPGIGFAVGRGWRLGCGFEHGGIESIRPTEEAHYAYHAERDARDKAEKDRGIFEHMAAWHRLHEIIKESEEFQKWAVDAAKAHAAKAQGKPAPATVWVLTWHYPHTTGSGRTKVFSTQELATAAYSTLKETQTCNVGEPIECRVYGGGE